MIYKIYKVNGRIGTELEKSDAALTNMQDISSDSGNRTSLAAYDNQTNTIHIFNDTIVDVSSLVQKFKNYDNLPNNHQFNIVRI